MMQKKTTAFELHDSMLKSIRTSGQDVLISFDPAIIHSSFGEPGVDPGEVFRGNVRIRLLQCSPEHPAAEKLGGDISDGILSIGSATYADVLPCPLQEVAAKVMLNLNMSTAESLTFYADGVKIEMVGELTFLEEFQ